MSIVDVKLERLSDVSQEEFEQFGRIIGREDINMPFSAKTPDFVAYSDIVPALENEKGRFSIGMLALDPKPAGSLTMWTEYHAGSDEFFFPLDGKEAVFVIAPAGKEASTEKTRAFIVGPNEGIMIRRGVWHHPPYALSEHTKVLMPRCGDLIVKNGTLADRSTVYYGEEYRGYTGVKIGEYKIRVIY